jgi:hypothetical protein
MSQKLVGEYGEIKAEELKFTGSALAWFGSGRELI